MENGLLPAATSSSTTKTQKVIYGVIGLVFSLIVGLEGWNVANSQAGLPILQSLNSSLVDLKEMYCFDHPGNPACNESAFM